MGNSGTNSGSRMFRVDSLAHAGCGNAYTGSSNTGKKPLCAVYLSDRLSIYR